MIIKIRKKQMTNFRYILYKRKKYKHLRKIKVKSNSKTETETVLAQQK